MLPPDALSEVRAMLPADSTFGVRAMLLVDSTPGLEPWEFERCYQMVQPLGLLCYFQLVQPLGLVCHVIQRHEMKIDDRYLRHRWHCQKWHPLLHNIAKQSLRNGCESLKPFAHGHCGVSWSWRVTSSFHKWWKVALVKLYSWILYLEKTTKFKKTLKFGGFGII